MDPQPPHHGMADCVHWRPATTPKAILAKRNTPFYASEISALQRGFRAAPVERPCPAVGMSIRCANGRPPPHLQAGRVLQRRAKAEDRIAVRKHAQATARLQCPS